MPSFVLIFCTRHKLYTPHSVHTHIAEEWKDEEWVFWRLFVRSACFQICLNCETDVEAAALHQQQLSHNFSCDEFVRLTTERQTFFASNSSGCVLWCSICVCTTTAAAFSNVLCLAFINFQVSSLPFASKHWPEIKFNSRIAISLIMNLAATADQNSQWRHFHKHIHHPGRRLDCHNIVYGQCKAKHSDELTKDENDDNNETEVECLRVVYDCTVSLYNLLWPFISFVSRFSVLRTPSTTHQAY